MIYGKGGFLRCSEKKTRGIRLWSGADKNVELACVDYAGMGTRRESPRPRRAKD